MIIEVDEAFSNFHTPHDWWYVVASKKYIKVGAYGIDDLEVIEREDRVFVPEYERYYNSIEEAYTDQNRLWMLCEELSETNQNNKGKQNDTN